MAANERIVWFTWKDRSNPLAGGAEVINEELAKRLAADGHHVTLIVGGFAGASHTEQRDGFTIIRVGNRVSVYVAAWRYFRAHRVQLRPTLVIDETNTVPFFAGWYVRAPTVLFFHMLCRQIWFFELPLPLAVIGWLIEPIYLRLLRRAPVIAMSPSTRDDLIRHGFKANDISLISEAIELTPVTSLDITKYPQPTVLAFGAMRSMKQAIQQVEAFELAKPALPALKLKVAGDTSGAYGAKVLARIRASRYRDDIEVLGRVSDATKIELMQKCHVLLVTSVKEGWCLVVTEAASQGTPAIVYNADGLRDSVRDGVTGVIVNPNPSAMATAIINTFADPSRYDNMRTAAWEWSKEMTFDRSYDEFVKALGISA